VTAPTETAIQSPVSGFSHMQLLVSDLEVSRQWYATALGLQTFTGSAEVGYIAMGGAGGRFAIVLSPRPADAPSGSPVDHLAFGVRSVDELADWAEALTAAGIEHAGLVESGEGTSVHIVDPDGLNVELIAARR
jgi:catechol 2,3-dioxygenase-like lactoylglutathione lyase family enzyme